MLTTFINDYNNITKDAPLGTTRLQFELNCKLMKDESIYLNIKNSSCMKKIKHLIETNIKSKI
jgi:hypothetical protein